MEDNELVFDERESAEIRLALFYADRLHHGTAGHNRLMLIAKMAQGLGISLTKDGLLESGHEFTGKIWWKN